MWMMIAGSATLRNLHDRAREWLISYGHEADANAVLRKEKRQEGKQAKQGKKRGKQR
jgi:hypothetical protein